MKSKFEEEFNKAYQKLNKNQKEAVDAIEGPVMVVAGPGTGKTQILALRIANILRQTDAKPEDILALTFTNSGVISMRERLGQMIGDAAYRINIFTFHSFCEKTIKDFPFYFKRFVGARVINDLERVEILEAILKKNDFSELSTFNDEFYFLKDIVRAINNIKKEGLSVKQFAEFIPAWRKDLLANEDVYYKRDYGEYKKGDIKPAEKEKIDHKIEKVNELQTIFGLYQAEIEKLGRYDFSDMILSVLAELETNADLKADLSEKFQYVLVDEHQDTNRGQNRLIELLTDAPHLEGRANIFAVGDEKQSIYRFQGASRETFRHFESLYKDVKNITLADNYRSTAPILNSATSLIKNTPDLAETEFLQTHSEKNEKVIVREFSNFKFELLHLADDIKKKIDRGVKPSEIAVIYRAHKYVYDIKSVFDHREIPYTILSKGHILNDGNIKNLITILRVVHNPNDEESLGKALFINFLGLDAYDSVRILEKFRRTRTEGKKHIFAIIENKKALQEAEVKNADDFVAFAELIKKLKTESEMGDFPNFFKSFLESSGYLKAMLSSADGQDRLLKIDKLFDEIKKQAGERADYKLSNFIYFVDAFLKYNLDIESSAPEIVEGVNLMTAHGSKGREFEYVYIINAIRRGWENSGANGGIDLPIEEYEGDIEDERRLFYVAMTRAKHHLAISFSHSDNEGRENEPSEFLSQIDPESIESENMSAFEEKNLNQLFDFVAPNKSLKSLYQVDYIRQIFFRRTLNVSALNNYLSCPLRYFYKNLLQIPSSYESRLEFGSAIHESLEEFFRRSKEAEKILPKAKLLASFKEILEGKSFSDKEEKKFKERGEELLSEYYDAYADTWTHKVDLEKYIKRDFEVDSGEKITISGMIDKIEYLDDLFGGRVNIVDYKTGRSFSEKTKDEKKDYERQIVFYHLLLDGYDENVTINQSMLDFIEKNKKGVFEQHSFPVTAENLAELKEEINTCVREVLSLEFLKKGCGKRDCEWCGLSR